MQTPIPPLDIAPGKALPTLMERLAALISCTAAEQKLATYCEREYRHLAFENLADISSGAGVGKATVTRFVQRLGYASFPAFLRAVREEAAQTLDSPIERYSRKKIVATDPMGRFTEHMAAVTANVQRTLEINNGEPVTRIVELLTDTSRPLFVMGAASAQGLAYYFSIFARYLRSDVHLLDANISTAAHRLVGAGPAAVLLVIAFHRCSRVSYELMRLFHRHHRPVVLITDRHSTTLTRYATWHLVAYSEEGASIFNSRAAGLAMLEGLLSAMTPALEHQTQQRFEEMEEIFADLHVFAAEIDSVTPQRRLEHRADKRE